MSNIPDLYFDQRRKRILTITLWMVFAATLLFGFFNINLAEWRSALAIFSASAASLIGVYLNAKKHPLLATILLCASVLITMTYSIFDGDGLFDPGIVGYPLFILLGAMLLDKRSIPWLLLASCLSLSLVAYSQASGLTHPTIRLADISMAIPIIIFLAVASLIVWVIQDQQEWDLGQIRRGEQQIQAILDNTQRLNAELQQELTERKQAEEALQKSEAKFRAIIENSHDGIAFLTAEGVFLYRSSSYSNLDGYIAEEQLGQNGFLLVHPEDFEQARQRWEYGLQHPDTNHRVEYRFKHKDGTWRWIESLGKNLLDNPDIQLVLLTSRDITERKRAEEELQRSEAKFRAIVENSNDGIVFMDAQGMLLYRSPSLQQINGYTDAERLGQSGFDTIHADDLDSVRCTWEEALKHPDTAFRAEYRILHKNGAWKWVEATVKNLLGDPNVQAVIVTSRDITQRKQAEEDLHASEALFRALVENSHDGMVLMDSERKVKYVSPSYVRVAGYSVEELSGAFGPHFIHPDDRASAANVFGQVLLNPGKVFTLEYRLKHKQGHWFWLETKATNLLDDPHLQAVILNSRDITERREAEDRLRESEARFRALSEDALVGVYIIQDGAAAYVNPTLEKIFGYEPEELIGSSPLVIAHPDDHALISGNIRRRLEGEIKSAQYEFRGKRKNGETIYVETMGTRIDLNGRPAIIGNLLDITERKRAEEQLEVLKYSIDTAPDGAYRMDRDGYFVYANDIGCTALGYSKEELLKMHVSEVNPRATRERWEQIWQSLKELGHFTIQSIHRRKDGSEFPVELTSAYGTFGEREFCSGFAKDITERIKAAEALRQRDADMQRSALEERQRLARDLHDAVSQTLFSASFTSEMLLRQRKTITPRTLWKNIKHLSKLVDSALGEMRILLLELRPESLVNADLPALLTHLMDAAGARASAQINLELQGEVDLPVEPKIAFYRIVQEALNNVIKHADCSQVNIHLRGYSKTVELRIEDDGVGFDVRKVQGAKMGLNIMRERASEVGADLKIVSGAGKGTQIICKWKAGGNK